MNEPHSEEIPEFNPDDPFAGTDPVGQSDPNETAEFHNFGTPPIPESESPEVAVEEETTEAEAVGEVMEEDADAAGPGRKTGQYSARGDQTARAGTETRKTTSSGTARPGTLKPTAKGQGKLVKVGVGSVVAVALGAGGVYFSGMLGDGKPVQAKVPANSLTQTGAGGNTTANPSVNPAANSGQTVDPNAGKVASTPAGGVAPPANLAANNTNPAGAGAVSVAPTLDTAQSPVADAGGKPTPPAAVPAAIAPVAVQDFKEVVALKMDEFSKAATPQAHADVVDQILSHGRRIPAEQAEQISAKLLEDLDAVGADEALEERLVLLYAKLSADVPLVVNEEAPAEPAVPATEAPKSEAAPATEKETPEEKPEEAKPEEPKSESGAMSALPATGADDSVTGEPLPGLLRLVLFALGGVEIQPAPEKVEANPAQKKIWDLLSKIAKNSDDKPEDQAYALLRLAGMCRENHDWKTLRVFVDAGFKTLEVIKPDVANPKQAHLLNVKEHFRDYQRALQEHELAAAVGNLATQSQALSQNLTKESQRIAQQSCVALLKNLNLTARLEKLDPEKAAAGTNAKLVELLKSHDAERKALAEQVAAIEQNLKAADRTAEESEADRNDLLKINQTALQWQVEHDILAGTLNAMGADGEKPLTAKQITTLAENVAKKEVGGLADQPPFKAALAKLKDVPETFPSDLVGEEKVTSLIKKAVPDVVGTEVSAKIKEFVSKLDPADLKTGGAVARLVLLAGQVDEMRTSVNAVSAQLQQVAAASQTAKAAAEQAKIATSDAAALKAKLKTAEDALQKQLADVEKAVAKRITGLEDRVGAVKDRIEVVRVEPRSLPDTERDQLATQAADRALQTMLKWGYIPAQWSTPASGAKPSKQDRAVARRHFIAGRDAYTSASAGSPEKSIRELSQAATLDPTKPLYRFYLALALYREGQFDEAARQVQQGASMEGPSLDSSLTRDLEPIQGTHRRWLDQIRTEVRARQELASVTKN